MSPARRKSLFEKLSVAIPNPETELAHDNSFQLLISVLLSAQATDISVNKVTPALFEAFPDPESMATARVEQILSFIRSIGLAPSKAKNIVNTCSLLVEKHQGQIPQTLEELIALPGVGRKTANVMLNTAFGKSVIAVDTHIFRVSNRTGLAIGKDVREVEDGLMKNVPRKFKKDAHHLLILHGRYVCKARKPECSQCVIRRQCQFEEKII
jgi:endonuclease-3